MSSVPFSKHTVAITQGGAIQLANNGTDGVQGLQTLTMTNAAAAAQPGATILQYAQTSDGQQILVPSNQVVVQGEIKKHCNDFILVLIFIDNFCSSAVNSKDKIHCYCFDLFYKEVTFNIHSLPTTPLSCLWWRPGLSDPSSPCQHHRPWGGHGLFPSPPHPGCHRGGHPQTGSSPHEKQVWVKRESASVCGDNVFVLEFLQHPQLQSSGWMTVVIVF